MTNALFGISLHIRAAAKFLQCYKFEANIC